jgi:hypothetical protein
MHFFEMGRYAYMTPYTCIIPGESQGIYLDTIVRLTYACLLDMVSGYSFTVGRVAGEPKAT